MLNDKIYVTGGCFENAAWVSTNTVLIFDDSSSSSTSSSSSSSSLLDPSKAIFVQQVDAKQLITARYGHASAVHDNKLWIAGGRVTDGDWLSSVEVLDLTVGRMEMKAQSMQMERVNFSLVEVNGELYAVGGDPVAEGNMSIEKKSNETGEWEVIVDEYDGGHRWNCAVVAVGSKIFVIGGVNINNDKANRTWDAYDVLTGQWASATLSKKARRVPRKKIGGGQAVLLPALMELN